MGVHFEEFIKVSKKEWLEKVNKELKGKSFDEFMVHESEEGIRIEPLYTSEDQSSFQGVESFRGWVNPPSEIPGMPPRIWSNVASFKTSDSNASVLHVLGNGADALLLNLDGSENLSVLLENVAPQYIQVYIQSNEPLVSLKKFFHWTKAIGVDPHQISGGLLWDPLVSLLAHPSDIGKIVDQIQEILNIGGEYSQFKLLSIDTSIYHNSGANSVQELGFALSSFIDIVDILTRQGGLSPKNIFSQLIVKSAVGSDYFIEIAKLKILRIIVHRMASLYDVNISPDQVTLFVETSFWTKTQMDVHVNMLRNTTEAMAAILGGCNALHTLTHDIAQQEANSFSKRMALNISNIIKEESYFDKVMDPVAGSYFIEQIMGQLYNKVQHKLVDIEQTGGWLKLYESMEVQREIKNTRSSKRAALEKMEKVIVGVNKYIFTDEKIIEHSESIHEESYQLLPQRLTALLESKKISVHEA
jgi:methylmalonyl-CoA mutase